MKINVLELVPENWVVEESKDSVTLWFSSSRGNCNRKQFMLPKQITVDGTFAEAIGMFLGDGDLHRKEKGHLGYASKDLDIMTFILNFLRQRLHLKINDSTISVQYRDFKPDINLIADALNVLQDRLKTRYSKRHRYYTIQLQVNGVVFRLFFERLVNAFLTSNFLDRPKLRQGFLRGLFAAEGCVAIQYQENYINYIGFALSSHERNLLALLTSALKAEQITYKIVPQRSNCNEIIISHWHNYFKCWQIRLFDLCSRKKQKFISMAQSRKIGCVLSPEDLRQIAKQFTQKEIAHLIGSWQGNVCRALQGKFLFTIDNVQLFRQLGIPIKIQMLRVGPQTELPYSKETRQLFCTPG